MSKALFLILVLGPLALGFWLICYYGLEDDGVQIFGGILLGAILSNCWRLFGRHYERVQRHNNGLFETQLFLDRNWSAATYNLHFVRSNVELMETSAKGAFGKMMNEYSSYEQIEDSCILKLANPELMTDLLVLNKRLLGGGDQLRVIEKLWQQEIEPILGKELEKSAYESKKALLLTNLRKIEREHSSLVERLEERLADVSLLMKQKDWFSRCMSALTVQPFHGNRIQKRAEMIKKQSEERRALNEGCDAF